MKNILIWVGCIVALLLFLLGGAVMLADTEAVQRRLMNRAVTMLTEKLQTEVHVDSVSVGLFSHDVRLIGLTVWDRQQREMLHVGLLSAKVNLWSLLRGETRVSKVRLADVKVLCVQPPGEPANYQFVIDAFKSDKTQAASPQEKKTRPMKILLRDVRVERVHVTYNEMSVSMESLLYRLKREGKFELEVTEVGAEWVMNTKRGKVDAHAALGHLAYEQAEQKGEALVTSLRFTTDNHQLRKNVGRPKRGFFDVGHLDVKADMHVRLDSIGKEGVRLALLGATVADQEAGIRVSELNCTAGVTKSQAMLSDLFLKWGETELSIPKATVHFPNKKNNLPLAYEAPRVEGRVVLRDIARTFAPVLSKFSQPLCLETRWNGNADGMTFSEIHVSTPDRKFSLEADGGITDLKNKYKMVVAFDVKRMVARGTVKRTLINQFPVKKFMMKQVDALGDITYRGGFRVLWKQEQFNGSIQTKCGNIAFRFSIDEINKYLQGHAASRRLQLGRVLDYPDLGDIACAADFKFDISKPRTAQMRKRKGGKLPIGSLKATVDEVTFKKLKFNNITAAIESDGAEAQGQVSRHAARIDLLCGFSFTNTDELRKMRVKPGVRIHGLSDDDKAAREQRKAQKKAEKEARRQQRQAEKEARKAAKDRSK